MNSNVSQYLVMSTIIYKMHINIYQHIYQFLILFGNLFILCSITFSKIFAHRLTVSKKDFTSKRRS